LGEGLPTLHLKKEALLGSVTEGLEHGCTLVNMAIHIGELLDWMSDYQLLKKTLLQGISSLVR